MLAVRRFVRQKDRMYVVRVGHTASCDRSQRRLREGATAMHATLQQVCAQLEQAAPRFFAQHIRAAATEACEQAAALVAALVAAVHCVESDLEQEEQVVVEGEMPQRGEGSLPLASQVAGVDEELGCGVSEGELADSESQDGEHPVERVVTLYTRQTAKAWPCEMVTAATAARRATDSVTALQRALDNAAMQSTIREGET